MPACLARRSLAGRTLPSASVRTLVSQITPGHSVASLVNVRRYTFATSEVARTSIETENRYSRNQALILLQRTLSLLPQAFSTVRDGEESNVSSFWRQILEGASTEIHSSSMDTNTKARISVCGVDQWAGCREFVTALLEDPFASDPTYSDTLRNRWKSDPPSVVIEYGSSATPGAILCSPSSWLRQFAYEIQLSELPDLLSLSPIRAEVDGLLLSSDILLLLWDPLTTTVATLIGRAGPLLNRQTTILVLTFTSFSEHHHACISRELSDAGCKPGHILFVDPKRAVDGITALQSDPVGPSAIAAYQADMLGSRISTVSAAVGDLLNPDSFSNTFSSCIRTRTALEQVQSTLNAGSVAVQSASDAIDQMHTNASELKAEVRAIQERAVAEALDGPEKVDSVALAFAQGTKEMKTILDALTFWKMVWRVDEIGMLVSTAVQRRWYKELENQLILQTGRLSSVQNHLTNSAFNLLAVPSTPSPASVHSPVLINQLQQLEQSSSYNVLPSTLTQPIQNRRSQLIEYTTTRLHREAQNAVLAVFGGTLGGSGLTWWLTFGEHLSLGTSSEIGTAVGVGMLVAASCVRWGVGKWERAKRKWMQDSVRVGESARRDLEATIKRTVDEKVVIVAATACDGLEQLLSKRQTVLSKIKNELQALEVELHGCKSRTVYRTRTPDL
ncbi:hypothetical protein F5I97DRAFT_1854642 [Phlebopus sp. FC_14]|nr:hypothetical protein F5I97DRAFT_1854642 [Phlebopus sp. FC_14]